MNRQVWSNGDGTGEGTVEFRCGGFEGRLPMDLEGLLKLRNDTFKILAVNGHREPHAIAHRVP